MTKPLIYLAGPITGTSYNESTDWRKWFERNFEYAFRFVSPMRNKDYLKNETEIKDAYEDILFSSGKGVFGRDMHDVLRCDALLVNFQSATRVSIGSVMELSVAWYLRKPVILIMEKDNIHRHCMVLESTPWIVETVEEGQDVLFHLFA